MKTVLEHVNVTVRDPDETAAMLVSLFDWRIRWKGEAKNEGYSVHVGGDDSYIAVYRGLKQRQPPAENGDRASYSQTGGLNHIAVVVDDLDEAEARTRTAGFEPYSFGDYEPGRRFYFNDADEIIYEVVSYA